MSTTPLFILGSTGLVGEQVVKYGLTSKDFNKIITLTRSKPDFATNEKVESIVNTTTSEWPKLITSLQTPPKAYISSFGTTRAKAGSAENFKKIDYGINYECAKAAKEAGATTCVLVSAMGADSKSPFLYMKTKGELENAIKDLNFDYTIILRPGVLVGNRKTDHGWGNSIAMTVGRWTKGNWLSPLTRAIDVNDVGKIAIDFAERGLKQDLRENVLIVSGAELCELAEDLKVV
ncbi:FMP52 [Candida pseudojiufengensis]|uniref:FMP52 n=1 Tax=Candida pseudojiufengensis TaxID=497109 RepID=UPI0022252BB6|nr:FMP52 [Candida pseudojiufengensis]KAI5963750.1 FMP52 [Candida pseudojiufengensis]